MVYMIFAFVVWYLKYMHSYIWVFHHFCFSSTCSFMTSFALISFWFIFGLWLQKKHNSVSHNSGRMDNYHKEQTVSGFMIGPSERGQALREGRGDFMERQRKKVSHSGPLVQGNGWTRTGKNFDNHNMVSGRHNLSTISGLVATRTILPGDDQEKPGVPQPEVVKQVGRLQGSINGLESSRRVDQNCQIQKMRYSPQAGAGKSGNKEPSLVSSREFSFSDSNVSSQILD